MGRQGHQKRVLHHVHSEQFFVELAKRGTDGDPHEKNPQTNAAARQTETAAGNACRR